MSKNEFHQKKLAVIGTGNIGKAVAQNLVKGNRAVIIADRSPEKAAGIAADLGNLARPMGIAEAIKAADIIVFAIGFDAIKELLKQYAADLDGKIIVDPSNPIAPDENGGFKKIIPAGESAGEILSALVPDGAKYVKALGTLGVATLLDKAFQTPEKSVLFYATDHVEISAVIDALIADMGFDPFCIGGINQSIRIEVFGDLHEFGAVGKSITLPEAEQLLGHLV